MLTHILAQRKEFPETWDFYGRFTRRTKGGSAINIFESLLVRTHGQNTSWKSSECCWVQLGLRARGNGLELGIIRPEFFRITVKQRFVKISCFVSDITTSMGEPTDDHLYQYLGLPF